MKHGKIYGQGRRSTFDFRKTGGVWQRRPVTGGRWLTLSVVDRQWVWS